MSLFRKKLEAVIGAPTFPFLRSFVHNDANNFLTSTCTQCKDRINIGSMFGNSLVATSGGITIVCAKCRLGRPFSVAQEVAPIPMMDATLRQVGKLTSTGAPWILVLVGLRFSSLETLITRPKSFGFRVNSLRNWQQEGAIQDWYGSTFKGLYCGECSRFSGTTGSECSHCGFPLDHQWAFRSSFDDEMALLAVPDAYARIDRIFD
jgi:hypothetical protein